MLARTTLLLVLVSVTVAHADVFFEEPTQRTCGRSEVIVSGTVEGTTKAGPFTNGSPPTVKVTATECWQGCKRGDKLEIAAWVDAKASGSGKPRSADPKAELAAWEAAPVTPPAKGTKVLLFLYRDGKQLLRVQDSGGYGGFVMQVGVDDKQIAHSVGMCSFAMEIEGGRDHTAVAGKPVTLRFSVTNMRKTAAAFHGELVTLKLQTDTRPGDDLAPTWGKGQPKLVTMKAGAKLAFDWDLAALFPGDVVKPGHYWLTVQGPGALSEPQITITVQ